MAACPARRNSRSDSRCRGRRRPALGDLQEQGIIERRMGSGSFVRADRPVASATSARELGLLVPFWGKGVFASIFGDIAGFARANDFLLLWDKAMRVAKSAEEKFADAEELCQHYIERRVAGVFFQPWECIENYDAVNFRLADRLHQSGLPVVLVDCDLVPFPRRTDFDLVEVDNFAGGYMVAEHLAKLGCRRMVFLTHPRHCADRRRPHRRIPRSDAGPRDSAAAALRP